MPNEQLVGTILLCPLLDSRGSVLVLRKVRLVYRGPHRTAIVRERTERWRLLWVRPPERFHKEREAPIKAVGVDAGVRMDPSGSPWSSPEALRHANPFLGLYLAGCSFVCSSGRASGTSNLI